MLLNTVSPRRLSRSCLCTRLQHLNLIAGDQPVIAAPKPKGGSTSSCKRRPHKSPGYHLKGRPCCLTVVCPQQMHSAVNEKLETLMHSLYQHQHTSVVLLLGCPSATSCVFTTPSTRFCLLSCLHDDAAAQVIAEAEKKKWRDEAEKKRQKAEARKRKEEEMDQVCSHNLRT